MDEITKLWYTTSNEDARKLYQYLSMFGMNEKELSALPRGEDEFMDKFRDRVFELNQDEELVRFATEEEDHQMQLNSERKIGLETGREEGRDEGREEERIEIAKSMLEKNYDVQEIKSLTGLSIEEIESL